ncbi:hypothetical protein [Algoriphagus halophilus]|uniref:Aerotolerance regulator N-terminal domain-containing protein n=1 Tax=Algoriphagus halophilus TaxID=226505 RepID=A0A1N6EGB6_9BACT|nr:hypothetical protein [Algoriphagus halophilus]SIN82072.1 hypothetical protein SAMN05444394_2124 [Algoriphagus halophilus]
MMNFNPSIPIGWLTVFSVLTILVLGFQLFWIYNLKISNYRKWAKSLLNIIFATCLLAYLFQPTWISRMASEPVLVYSKDIPQERIRFLKDSLVLKREVPIDEYNGTGNPVYLIGKGYSGFELNKLVGKKVNWIRSASPNKVEHIHWRGLLNQGEVQKIAGEIQVDKPSLLELKILEQRIAFDSLHAGTNIVEFNFPVYISGRNEWGLYLNDSLQDEIRFFVQATKPKSYSLQFSFPDPEVRALSQYLIKKGAKVEEQIKVSRSSEIASGTQELDSLTILISDIEQLQSGHGDVDIHAGIAGILLINTQNPESDVKALNELYETNFEITRSTSEEYRVLESGIEVLPYSFVPKTGQKTLFENSVAVQDQGDLKIGFSLLSQTFPKYLSGDTLAYEQIWNEILSLVTPGELENWNHSAPVFTNQVAEIVYNGINREAESILLSRDTVYFQHDLINPLTKRAQFISLESGWVSLADSMEVYVYGENELNSVRSERILAEFFREGAGHQIDLQSGEEKSGVSEWVFLILFLILLGALWVEPRINY